MNTSDTILGPEPVIIFFATLSRTFPEYDSSPFSPLRPVFIAASWPPSISAINFEKSDIAPSNLPPINAASKTGPARVVRVLGLTIDDNNDLMPSSTPNVSSKVDIIP